MVDGGLAARGIVVDSAAVGLEALGAGIDEDGEGRVGVQGVGHAGCVHGGCVPVGGDVSNSLGVDILATVISGSVGVVTLKHLSSLGHDGLISSGSPSSIARSISTVDKLLFGETVQGSGRPSPGSLNGSCDGESPTGSTPLLILDSGDHVVIPEIVGIGGRGLAHGLNSTNSSGGLCGEDAGPLLVGPVRPLVDGGVEGGESSGVLGVVLVDEFKGFLEESLPLEFLTVAPVDLVVGLLEVLPLGGGGSSCHGDQSEDYTSLHF